MRPRLWQQQQHRQWLQTSPHRRPLWQLQRCRMHACRRRRRAACGGGAASCKAHREGDRVWRFSKGGGVCTAWSSKGIQHSSALGYAASSVAAAAAQAVRAGESASKASVAAAAVSDAYKPAAKESCVWRWRCKLQSTPRRRSQRSHSAQQCAWACLRVRPRLWQQQQHRQ